MAVRPLHWDLVSPALGSVPSCTGICPLLQWDHCPSPVWRQGQGGRGTAGRAPTSLSKRELPEPPLCHG